MRVNATLPGPSDLHPLAQGGPLVLGPSGLKVLVGLAPPPRQGGAPTLGNGPYPDLGHERLDEPAPPRRVAVRPQPQGVVHGTDPVGDVTGSQLGQPAPNVGLARLDLHDPPL